MRIELPGCYDARFERKITGYSFSSFSSVKANLQSSAGSTQINSIQLFVLFDFFKSPIYLKTGMWKRLNFCESGSTLKKEAGSGSKLGSI